jgi:hypothetical protein
VNIAISSAKKPTDVFVTPRDNKKIITRSDAGVFRLQGVHFARLRLTEGRLFLAHRLHHSAGDVSGNALNQTSGLTELRRQVGGQRRQAPNLKVASAVGGSHHEHVAHCFVFFIASSLLKSG